MSASKQTPNRSHRKSQSTFQRLARRFMSGLLRSLFFVHKPARRTSQSGFVLPTTVLLLLVMTLTVGALTFRTASRTQSAFSAREQQILENVSAPAADRAKAKLEYLFSKDARFPGTSTPASDVLVALMLNVDVPGLGIDALGTDPYTLPDETRIDINGDGADNAWSFSFDVNGDGTLSDDEVIAYSVLMDDSVDPLAVDGDPATDPTPQRDDDIKLEDTGASETIAKANNLVTRNGPINTNNSLSNCGGARAPAQGWLTVGPAALEKNFQITAFASNGKNPGRANSALELQQVRISQLGNTWGAWFKYDMEIHPGPDFNWNGAIHTDGNLLITNNFRGHMISSHNSCLYSQNASAITMDAVDNNNDKVININPADSPDFKGQLIAGAPTYQNLNGRGNPLTHLFTNLNSRPTTGGDDAKINRNRDSVTGTTYQDMIDVLLDPLPLFTRNIQRHRRTGTWTRDSDWAGRAMVTSGRVTNQSQNAPFLDDFFRADDRYGPRPSYESYNWVTSTEVDGVVNTNRNEVAYDKQLGDEIIATDPRASNLTNNASGSDGYWERQSILNGMRVIVGQRLELGNMFGWNFDANGGTADPLYPPEQNGMANKQKQRVTLRDNLSAVQGMVVYHYDTNTGQYPLACIANTAHPGTIETIRASRTFNTYDETGDLNVDFLSGNGTNGWEFSFPTAFDTEVKFGAALGINQPLGRALRNLAYFAGDPNGGSPSFTPVQDATVHPFPQQAMWGDFSVLRRIFDERLDSLTWRTALNPPQLVAMADRYSALSPADKSSLHSAACTQGLLAYNLSTVENEYAAIPDDDGVGLGLNDIGLELSNLMDGDATNGEIGSPPSPYDPDYYAQFTAQDWIDALDRTGSPFTTAERAEVIRRAQVVAQRQQIERDRSLGFIPANESIGTPSAGIGYVAALGTYLYPGLLELPFTASTYKVGCDPNSFAVTGTNANKARLGLAMAFCSIAEGPKYPSLYYLFPKTIHGQTGLVPSVPLGLVPYPQPNTEEYVSQSYLSDPTNGVNRAVFYQVVGDDGTGVGNLPAVEDATDTGIAAIAFEPRPDDGSDWILPTTVLSSETLNPESMTIRIPNGNRISLSLLDKVMYNGREEMAVRVLDIDLGKLTQNSNGADFWISDARDTNNGMLYAAREDAAREDTITRPATAGTTWADCDSLNEILTANACWMRPSLSTGATDPPLSQRTDGSIVGISVKPVDFAPDPDRRSYGFRLNAALDGNNGDLSNSNARTSGFTFVTDNAAYIKGEFNPHTSDGTDTLEEFTETLYDGAVAFGNEFYDDRVTSNLSNFATNGTDRWRVAEVLADAVYLLSDNFVDGAVQEGFIRDRDQVSTEFQNTGGNDSRTSFHNQQRPLKNNDDAWDGADNWLRVDGSYGNNSIPIWVGRNGESRTNPASSDKLFNNAASGAEFELPNQRDLGALIDAATPERINATIISGIVPSRSKQGYGGLHNFPRFQEDWNEQALFIQGAFLQLNFSTSGTGPFDLDAWEPGDTPVNAEDIEYYRPPSRRWGYDVALQLVPAGPIASRFVTVGRPRSEHFRELSIEDPYVTTLRCSLIQQDPSNPASPWIRQFPDEVCP